MTANQKKLEALKAEVEARKQEFIAAQARLDEVEAKRWALEREINRTQRPTPAMLVVLKQMAAGAVVRENRYNYGSYYLSTENENTPVRNSVFYGLCTREAINQTGERGVYGITEHGKSFIQHSTRQ